MGSMAQHHPPSFQKMEWENIAVDEIAETEELECKGLQLERERRRKQSQRGQEEIVQAVRAET